MFSLLFGCYMTFLCDKLWRFLKWKEAVKLEYSFHICHPERSRPPASRRFVQLSEFKDFELHLRDPPRKTQPTQRGSLDSLRSLGMTQSISEKNTESVPTLIDFAFRPVLYCRQLQRDKTVSASQDTNFPFRRPEAPDEKIPPQAEPVPITRPEDFYDQRYRIKPRSVAFQRGKF